MLGTIKEISGGEVTVHYDDGSRNTYTQKSLEPRISLAEVCVYMYVCICVYVHVSTNVYTGAREAGDDSVITEALYVFLYVSLYVSLCVPLYTGAREAGDAGGPREGKGVHRHVCKVFLFFFFSLYARYFFSFFPLVCHTQAPRRACKASVSPFFLPSAFRV